MAESLKLDYIFLAEGVARLGGKP